MVKVHAMTSPRSGEAVRNQFVIHDYAHRVTYFQSYKSTIAQCDYDGTMTLFHNWDYSVTTVRYLHRFIAAHAAISIQRAIVDAPGKSYADKIRACIASGVIRYRGDIF